MVWWRTWAGRLDSLFCHAFSSNHWAFHVHTRFSHHPSRGAGQPLCHATQTTPVVRSAPLGRAVGRCFRHHRQGEPQEKASARRRRPCPRPEGHPLPWTLPLPLSPTLHQEKEKPLFFLVDSPACPLFLLITHRPLCPRKKRRARQAPRATSSFLHLRHSPPSTTPCIAPSCRVSCSRRCCLCAASRPSSLWWARVAVWTCRPFAGARFALNLPAARRRAVPRGP